MTGISRSTDQVTLDVVNNNMTLTTDSCGFEAAVTESKVYHVYGLKYNL